MTLFASRKSLPIMPSSLKSDMTINGVCNIVVFVYIGISIYLDTLVCFFPIVL